MCLLMQCHLLGYFTFTFFSPHALLRTADMLFCYSPLTNVTGVRRSRVRASYQAVSVDHQAILSVHHLVSQRFHTFAQTPFRKKDGILCCIWFHGRLCVSVRQRWCFSPRTNRDVSPRCSPGASDLSSWRTSSGQFPEMMKTSFISSLSKLHE